LYVILPDASLALKDFFLHKGIIKALEAAFKDEECARVSILSPKLSLFGMSEEFYVEKLTKSLRVMALKSIPGVISAQLKPKFHKHI
jgi:hypothetical protein